MCLRKEMEWKWTLNWFLFENYEENDNAYSPWFTEWINTKKTYQNHSICKTYSGTGKRKDVMIKWYKLYKWYKIDP